MSREKNKLTSTDYELLEYIKENIMKKGFPPTVREMCKVLLLKNIQMKMGSLFI